MSDPPKRVGIDTVPPPPGEEDLYSASTVVGQASAELLALVRSAEQTNAERTAAKRASEQVAATEDDKLEAMKQAAARAAKQAVANEVAREATKAAQSGAPPPPSGQPAARVVSVERRATRRNVRRNGRRPTRRVPRRACRPSSRSSSSSPSPRSRSPRSYADSLASRATCGGDHGRKPRICRAIASRRTGTSATSRGGVLARDLASATNVSA
jgi:hypothetical protein